jgi:hypothetical protein
MRSEILAATVAVHEGTRESETSLEERAVRSARFVEGPWIRLADGRAWSFPKRPSDPPDPDYEDLLDAIGSAEDCNAVLSLELALAIFLLARNYDLSPDDYRRLLGFKTGHPSLAQMQTDFHAFALEQMHLLKQDRGLRGP